MVRNYKKKGSNDYFVGAKKGFHALFKLVATMATIGHDCSHDGGSYCEHPPRLDVIAAAQEDQWEFRLRPTAIALLLHDSIAIDNLVF